MCHVRIFVLIEFRYAGPTLEYSEINLLIDSYSLEVLLSKLKISYSTYAMIKLNDCWVGVKQQSLSLLNATKCHENMLINTVEHIETYTNV